jgi:hypothetical protein
MPILKKSQTAAQKILNKSPRLKSHHFNDRYRYNDQPINTAALISTSNRVCVLGRSVSLKPGYTSLAVAYPTEAAQPTQTTRRTLQRYPNPIEIRSNHLVPVN